MEDLAALDPAPVLTPACAALAAPGVGVAAAFCCPGNETRLNAPGLGAPDAGVEGPPVLGRAGVRAADAPAPGVGIEASVFTLFVGLLIASDPGVLAVASVFRLRTGADCEVGCVVDGAGGSAGVITLALAVGVEGVTLDGGVATFGRLGIAGEMVALAGGSKGTVEGPGVAAGVETVDDDPGVTTAGVGVEVEDPAGESAADPGVPDAADRSEATAGGCRLLIPSKISNCAGSNNLSA